MYRRWKRQSSGRPSEVLGIEYPWVEDDIDTAVIEFGEHVEAEIKRECELESDRLNSDLTMSQRRARIEAKAEEVWYRLVRREVRKKRQTMPAVIDGVYYPARVYYFVKPFTGNPEVDFNMSDAKVVWCDE